jgi:tRNA A37 threonylcarbamoyladenosine dehydratase
MVTSKMVRDLEDLLERFENNKLEISESKLSDLKTKQILLYGAGNVGKRLYRNLKENGIEVICFIDRNKSIVSLNMRCLIYI